MIPYVVVTAIIALVFVLPAWRAFRREEAEARELLAAAVTAGRHEPVSIHPWVDPDKCIGSGACVKACPEGDVLAVMGGKARIVNGSHCVGHGSCASACPVGAIELRFGTERRGVEIPAVGGDFQSNVKGVYVAGELGGMGLISNAVKQGAQAVGYLAKGMPPRKPGRFDVVIVGGGPAGIGAALAAKQAGLDAVILEQDTLGGSVTHFPRKKLVMSHGFQLPGWPAVPAGTLTKEDLVDLLARVVKEEDLLYRDREQVLGVSRMADGTFAVASSKRTLYASRVLLAVGRRGTPRRLDVPGEQLPKVAYRLVDPEQVQHAQVLVVGGGDSALEAAIALADQPGNLVTLSHRGDGFHRAKAPNREALEARIASGAIDVLLRSQVTEIALDRVVLRAPSGEIVIPNDLVYVFVGGVLPTAFLLEAGIEVQRHFGGRVEVVGAGEETA